MSLPLILLNLVAWSGLVWLGAALISCIGASPRMTRNIWRGAAGLMFLPVALLPFVSARTPQSGGVLPDMVLEGGVVTVGAAEIVSEVQEVAFALPELGTILMAVLIAGWVFRFGLSVFRQIRLQAIKRRAEPTELSAAQWAAELNLSREPEVRAIDSGSPFVAGVRRAVIHLPQSVLSLKGVEHVIVHECVHLKNGDTITRPIERLMADVIWFSPFAWLVRGQLDYWREAVVDEETSRLTGDRVGYARTLAAVARHARSVQNLPVAAFILPKEGDLKMRIKSVLDNSPRRPVATMVAAAAFALCLAPVAVSQAQSVKASTATAFSHPVLMEGRVSSQYGKRKHPVTKKKKFHKGIDIAVAEGTPIYAPAAGVVVYSGASDGFGENLKIELSDGRKLRFAQMLDRSVEAGDKVSAGDQIGRVGQSGAATGPHLHLELWTSVLDENGNASYKPVNPMHVPELILIDGVNFHPAAPDAPETPKAPKSPKAPKASALPAAPTACEHQEFDIAYSKAWKAAVTAAKAKNTAKGVSNIGEPETIAYPMPAYPDAAAKTAASGACNVLFDLSSKGELTVQDVTCSDPVFAESARAGMKTAKFKPVKVNGKAVDVKGFQYPLQYCIE